MLKEILMNDIRTVIGHNPSADELKVFMDYIRDTYDDLKQKDKSMYISNIELALYDCRRDNFHQCEECGDWFLTGSDDWNFDNYHCINCKPNSDPDMIPGGHDYY